LEGVKGKGDEMNSKWIVLMEGMEKIREEQRALRMDFILLVM
jgi:hypothetical protein